MKNNLEIGVFVKDKNIKGSYIPLNPQIFPFPFLKIEPTKTESVKKNGAELIIQSFAKIKKSDKEKSKILHSGIIRVDDCNDEVYFGDNINLKTNQKDFFILKMEKGILTMFYLKRRNPRNKVKFSKEFLRSISNR